MGQYLWTILTIKITGPEGSVVSRAMDAGGSALDRLSKACYNILRDSRGRLVDREVGLYSLVHTPSRLKTWAEVPGGFRDWEHHVAELERLSGAQIRGPVLAQALIRLLPTDLRDLALTQNGLDHSYAQLRDYIFESSWTACSATYI